MVCSHTLEASGAGAFLRSMPQSLTTCRRVEVHPRPDQAALGDGVINRHGLAHHLLPGASMWRPIGGAARS